MAYFVGDNRYHVPNVSTVELRNEDGSIRAFIPTVHQLRVERRIRSFNKISVEDLYGLTYTHPKVIAQRQAFIEADAEYERRREELADTLAALSESDWKEFCLAIGWEPVGDTQAEQVADYMARA